MTSASSNLLPIFESLCAALGELSFSPPVAYTYNPLEYAGEAWRAYLERYARGSCEVMFLGMNPGPWGMAQTGVPFGEIAAVRDWLGIETSVGRPDPEHPKRPVTGFDCPRSEVSGRRFWGWARDAFGSADAFFDRCFVANYCPLVWMEQSGRNRVPGKLPKAEREPVSRACDQALLELTEALAPQWVIGIGTYAEARATHALAGLDVKIGRILHPSPASPKANRGWAGFATEEMRALGIGWPGSNP